MLTKPADIKYCGVREDVIKSANPKINLEELKIHHMYLTERHEIYKKKEILKLPQEEWTDDPVFKQYRFTNIRRELDRESKWLIANISENDELTLEEKVYNTILFRAYNNSTTMKILGFPKKDFKNIDIDEHRRIIEEFSNKNTDYVWYSSAFNQGGLKYSYAFPYITEDKPYLNQSKLRVPLLNNETGVSEMVTYAEARDKSNSDENYTIVGFEKNIPLRMIHMIRHHANNNLYEKINECRSQEEVFNVLNNVHGFAKFLAYQIFVDLTYIPEFKYSENEFVISGPGCERGIDMLFDDRDGMTHDEALFWLRDNIEKLWKDNNLNYYPNELFDHLPEYDRYYNVMMLENSFCELSKFSKAKKGIGRPRNGYKSRTKILLEQIKCGIDEW